MEKLKKLFGGIRMSWPRVIIFALIAGIYTGLIALLVPDHLSFHDIATTFEWWILFAIIIITNCEKPLEAALKVFVFFLISQPLVYLVQVPFNSMGWGLFGYYRSWFIWTLLTLPMGYIGWYIKKGNLLSALILSTMLVFLAVHAATFIKSAVYSFPDHLLSAVFCLAQIVVLILCILKEKRAKLLAAAISVIALAVLLFFQFRDGNVKYETYIPPEQYGIEISADETVSVSDKNICSVYIVPRDDGTATLRFLIRQTGSNIATLTDPQGNTRELVIIVDDDHHVTIEQKDG